jgi:hypothetical protein
MNGEEITTLQGLAALVMTALIFYFMGRDDGYEKRERELRNERFALMEGRYSKGGQNEPNLSSERPPVPGGSGGQR